MAGRGRLSEFTGADSLPLDRFLRALDIHSSIGAALASIDERSLRILESYSRGVSAFIETQKLPAEFSLTGHRPAPWTPEDSLYVFAMLNLGISYNVCEELNFLLLANRVGYDRAAWLVPVYHDEELPFDETGKLGELPHEKLITSVSGGARTAKFYASVLPGSAPASNNWALSGRRTRSGPQHRRQRYAPRALHTEFVDDDAPALSRLRRRGSRGTGGAARHPRFQRPRRLGATMVMADSQDVFLEKHVRERETPVPVPRPVAPGNGTKGVDTDQGGKTGRGGPRADAPRRAHRRGAGGHSLRGRGPVAAPAPSRRPRARAALAPGGRSRNLPRLLPARPRALGGRGPRGHEENQKHLPEHRLRRRGHHSLAGDGKYLCGERHGNAPLPGWNGDYDWTGWGRSSSSRTRSIRAMDMSPPPTSARFRAAFPGTSPPRGTAGEGRAHP